MIDLRREKHFPVSDLRKFAGVDCHHRTIIRWAREGVKSRISGEVVLLEVFYVGRCLHTSLEAFYRFAFRMNGMAIPEDLANPLEELNVMNKKDRSAAKSKKPLPVKTSPPPQKKAAKMRGKTC